MILDVFSSLNDSMNPTPPLVRRSLLFSLPVAMVVLRAGLCPGLSEDMIQLLSANGIRTGNSVASGLGEHHPPCIWWTCVLPHPGRVVVVEYPSVSSLLDFFWVLLGGYRE